MQHSVLYTSSSSSNPSTATSLSQRPLLSDRLIYPHLKLLRYSSKIWSRCSALKIEGCLDFFDSLFSMCRVERVIRFISCVVHAISREISSPFTNLYLFISLMRFICRVTVKFSFFGTRLEYFFLSAWVNSTALKFGNLGVILNVSV